MALSYTPINTPSPEDLGDNNLLYINAYEVAGRGTLVQTYIEKPFNIQIPRNTNPETFKTEQVNPVLSEQSFFAQGLTISDLTGIRVGGIIPWTTLLNERLPRNQRRITRAATISGKGSLVQVYMETEYTENGKPKLTMAPEQLYWADGIEVSGTDFVSGGSASAPHYAEIWVSGNSTPTSIFSLSVWQPILEFTQNGQSSGATPDHTNDYITIARDGVYLVTVSASFTGGASCTYEAEVFKNAGVTPFQNIHAERKLNASSDISSMSLSGIASLSASDTVEVWIRQTAGSLTSPTFKHVTLSVSEVGK